MKAMKLGSLFDGSGGFPLAGSLCGIEPVWAANADRIRAMSDEELAAWAINEAPKIGFRYTSSETGLLKWLKQPAEEDD